MNILNVCQGGDWDMISYQALHTAARFLRMGHNSAVVCPRGSRLAQECAKLNVQVKPFTLGAKLGFFDAAGWDIVHFYNPDLLNPMTLKKIRPAGRVFVSQVKFGGPKAYERLAAAQPYVDKFLAACISIQEDMLNSGIDRPKTFMVPPCLNIGRWESAMLIKPAMGQKRVYKVGTVSMDRTLREQELFLLMAKEVLEVQPETNFMVVGLKDEKIRQLARNLGISHKVDVLWERNDMPEVMAMMDVCAKTARREGMSLSLIEAQASGVACVVPRLRGLSDFTVHDHNGLIVEPEDILGYTRAVIRLIGDPQLCHRMAKEAFGYVNDNMAVPVVANLLVRLYEEALAS